MRPDDRARSTPDAEAVLIETTRIIYGRRTSALTSHFLVGALAVVIAWDSPARGSNLVLVGLLMVYTASGLFAARRYLARPATAGSARRWALALYPQLAGLGLLYDLIFLNLARSGVPHALDYLLVIVALYSAGAAASYQHLRGLAIVFIVASAMPLAAYHLLTGEPGGQVIAILLVIFVVFMSDVSLALHRDAVERLGLTHELQTAKDAAEHLARTDSLTGLLNRRALFEVGRSLLAAARRHDRSLAAVMLDIDHFKSINDRFGHAAGDAVLVALAAAIQDTKRSGDIAGRLGGEEFAILLPETNTIEALRLAERLRRAIHDIRIDAAPGATITASLGVAKRAHGDLSLDSLIDRADRALYRAKQQGRDRAVVDSAESGPDSGDWASTEAG